MARIYLYIYDLQIKLPSRLFHQPSPNTFIIPVTYIVTYSLTYNFLAKRLFTGIVSAYGRLLDANSE